MKRTITAIAVAAVAIAGAIAVGTPALADSGTTVDAAKTALTNRINLRLTALQRDTTVIGAAKNLTAGHKSTLQALISQDTDGMNALKTKVAGETTLDALKADAQDMVNNFRIFILVGPKVRLTSASDTETVVGGKLSTIHDKLAALVAKAKAGGADTTAAEQELADMSTQLTNASSAISGQADGLLQVMPSSDGAGIQAKVAAVRGALSNGRSDLKNAESDAKKVRDFLQGLKSK
jgi:hypothetical protein